MSLTSFSNLMSPNKALTGDAKNTVSLLALIACMIYFFIRFFPDLRPLGVGLDPSWVYTINDAADRGLTFGKDIIFTYGPLGYLLTSLAGTGLGNSFFLTFSFQLLLHAALLILTLIKIHSLESILQKIILLLSLFTFYALATGLGVAPEYQILLLLFTFLSNEPFSSARHIRQKAAFLGVFAGFTLFTKFTISICAFAAILIFLVVSLFQAIKSRVNRKVHALAIADFFIASGTVSLILLNPDQVQGFIHLLFCLIVSGVTVCIKLVIQRFFYDRSHSQIISKRVKNFRQRSANQVIFYVVYLVSLLLVTFGLSPSLLAYIKGSLEFSSGYSSAMSIVGNSQHLVMAISVVLLVLAFLVSGMFRNNLSLSLSLEILLLIAFKHGFVRQDGHELIFLALAPWIVAMQVSRIRSRRFLTLGSALFLYTLIFSLWASSLFLPYFSSVHNFIAFLSPQAAMTNLVSALNLEQYRANLETLSRDNLRQRQLPSTIRKILGSKSVDIVPWESVIAAANDINWQPRPVFQSYAAYTAYLDRANFESLSKMPRDYLLYSFISIDGRHPFFDEPSTFRYIFCNYKVSNQLPDFITLGSKSLAMHVTLLEKQGTSVCGADTSEQTLSLGWRETKALPENELATYAAIDIRYSLLGKLYKTFFRAPAIRIRATYADGVVRVYRIVPDNAKNGLLLTYLPKDEVEAISLFNGHAIVPVKSFQLFNNRSLLFQPQIQLKLVSFPIQRSRSQNSLDRSTLRRTTFISRPDPNLIGHIDTAELSESGNYKGTLAVLGWAAAKDSAGSHWVLLTIGPTHQILGVMKTGASRPDVVKVLQDKHYEHSGWSSMLDVADLPRGKYGLEAWVYDASTTTARLIDQQQVILP